MPAELHPSAWTRALAHALTGCSECTRRVLQSPEEAVFRSYAGEEAAAPEVLREIGKLRRSSPLQRTLRARNASGPWRRSTAGALLSLAHRVVLEDPQAALDHAHLAVAVADSHCGADRETLRVEARGALANAQRVLGELEAADGTWAEVEDLRRRAELAPVRTGHLHMLRASLDLTRDRFSRAFTEMTGSLRQFTAAADDERVAAALIKMATVQNRLGDPAAALATNREAAVLLARNRIPSPRLRWVASHNMTGYLVRLGDWRAAEEMVEISRPLRERFAAAMERLRFDWLGGQIDLLAGRHRQAERRLLRTAGAFAERKLELNRHWIHLQLMEVYLAERRPDRVRAVGEPALACFRKLGLGAESAETARLLAAAGELERARRAGGEEALHRVPLPTPQVY